MHKDKTRVMLLTKLEEVKRSSQSGTFREREFCEDAWFGKSLIIFFKEKWWQVI